MGRAGPRPIIEDIVWVAPRLIMSKIDGPGRATAREIWALFGPLRPADDAAHVF